MNGNRSALDRVRSMKADDVVLVTLIAAALTAAFTGWAVWQRWRYTARPMWIAPRYIGMDPPHQGAASLSFEIENRGDAPAFDVHVFVIEPNRSTLEQKRWSVASVDTGDSIRVSVLVRARGENRYIPERDEYEDPYVITWVHRRVRIEWRQHPSMRRVRTKRFVLPEPQLSN